MLIIIFIKDISINDMIFIPLLVQ